MVTLNDKYKGSKSLTDLLNNSYEYLKNAFNSPTLKHLFAAKITVKNIDSCYKRFCEVIESYNKGDIYNSIELLKKIVILKHVCVLNKTVLKKDTVTYRFRLPKHRDDEIYEIFNREDLFHMPFYSLQVHGNRVDTGKWLVEHDELRVDGQATGYLRTTALTTRQTVTLVLAHLLQAELGDKALQLVQLLLVGEFLSSHLRGLNLNHCSQSKLLWDCISQSKVSNQLPVV